MNRLFRIGLPLLGFLLPAGLSGQDRPPESIFKEPLRIEASTVTATVPPVKVVEDTLVYNAAAYSLEEDAVLEDLLQKIPGLEVNGRSVTLYGRPVSKLLVNGKLYFGGDVVAGLKSIQADMVAEVRAYEMLSDFARISGIDDGEEVPVLDVRIKKRMMDGWQGSVTAGGGTESRFRGRFNAGKFTRESQTSLIGHLHNMPVGISLTNANYSQLGTGGSGDPTFRNLGGAYALKRSDLEINTNVQYSGNNRLVERENRSQSIQASGTSFYEGTSRTLSSSDKLNAEATLEWRPSPQWTLFCKPVFTWNRNGSWSDPFTTTFDADPELAADREAAKVNSSRQHSASYGGRTDVNLVLQATRRLTKRGRSLSLRTQGIFTGNRTASLNDYRADYFRKKRDPAIRKQFLETPSHRCEGTLQLSANEPLGKGIHLQAFIAGRYMRNASDRLLYSLAALAPDWTAPETLSEREARASLPAGYADGLDAQLTSYGLYSSWQLSGTVNLRIYRKKWNATLGATVKPQWSTIDYRTLEVPDGRETSFVCYAAPNLSLRYNKNKNNFLSFTYRSWSNAPSPYNLIPVPSGTNPLNVHIGNPELKPSFTHRINLNYNRSQPKRQRSFVVNLTGNILENGFCSSTEYDPETGGRTVLSKNIAGNWNIGGDAVYNRTLGKGPFSVCNHTAAQFNNEVAYLYNSRLKEDEVNTMKRLMLKDRFDLTWRSGRAEVIARAGVEFTDERSLLRPDMHQTPLTLLGGAETTLELPWKLRLSTDFTVIGQRGYAYEELNQTLFVWNASLSRRVLKGKGTIRLIGCDLLGQQVNMTRRFGAYSRAINIYNGVNQYVLLQFYYRFSR